MLGRVGGPPPNKRELDNVIYKTIAVRPGGIILYTAGKFQATSANPEEAQKLLAALMCIQGRPVILWRWSAYGCQHLDELDVLMYWLRFPGLPTHYFRLLDKVAAEVGKVVRGGSSYEEMVNGSV